MNFFLRPVDGNVIIKISYLNIKSHQISGQIPYVRDTEVRQVQEAAAEVGKVLDQEYAPKLAFTIITKKVGFFT